MKKSYTERSRSSFISSLSRGFTLIELLVTIAIIGILSATVIVAVNSARNKAKDARVKGALNQIRASLEIYKINMGNFNKFGYCIDANASSGCVATPTTDIFNNSCTIGGTLTKNWMECGIEADGDVDKIKLKINDFEQDIVKQVGKGTYWGLRVRGNSNNAVALAYIPSKFQTTGANNTNPLMCMDTKGSYKEYIGMYPPNGTTLPAPNAGIIFNGATCGSPPSTSGYDAVAQLGYACAAWSNNVDGHYCR